MMQRLCTASNVPSTPHWLDNSVRYETDEFCRMMLSKMFALAQSHLKWLPILISRFFPQRRCLSVRRTCYAQRSLVAICGRVTG